METRLPTRLGWALFIMAFVTNAVEIIVGLAVRQIEPMLALSPWFSVSLVAVGLYLCGYPVFCALTCKLPERKLNRPLRLGVFGVLGLFLICMFWGYVWSFVGVFISSIVSAITGIATTNPISDIAESSGIVPMAVIAGICSPIFEELIFRKIVLKKLLFYGEKTAVWFSAFTFGLMHMNLYQFFYAFAVGVVLGHVMVKTGRVSYTIILHIMINTTGSVLMPLLSEIEPSGYLTAAVMLVMMVAGFILWRSKKRDILANSLDPMPIPDEEQDYIDGGFDDAVTPESEPSPLAARDLYLNPGTIAYVLLCVCGIIYSVL